MAEVPWRDNVGEINLSEKSGEFFWMIPEMNFRHRHKCCISSPWFAFGEEKWRLVMTPSKVSDRYVGLFLWMKNRKPPYQKYNVSMGLRDGDGNMIRQFEGNTFSDYGFGNSAFLRRDQDPDSIYQYSRVKLSCEIRKEEDISDDDKIAEDDDEKENDKEEDDDEKENDEEEDEDEANRKCKKRIAEAKGVDRLLQNLRTLFLDGQNSDAVLQVGDHKFPVYKGILAVRSPVFASMFQRDTTEKNSGVVDIPDCTVESFEIFLLYLYTGSAEAMSQETVYNLYYAADKYYVDDLKAECVEYMQRNLSVDSFCDVFALSLRHSESQLLKATTQFFSTNIKKIIKTVQWQKFLKENSTHANELLIKALNA